MNIGLLGFDFSSANKGCEALAYSFINLLGTMGIEEKIQIYNFSYCKVGAISNKYPDIKFIDCKLSLKNPIYLMKLRSIFSKMDFIFDVTFGDGFSDIYGKIWLVITNILKQNAIYSKAPLVLLPQTYGPYKNTVLRMWSKSIIKHSDLVYSRDLDSANELNSSCGNNIIPLTDMAFALPYDSSMYSFNTDKVKIGINVSSLLWDSPYARDNKFALKVDYVDYINTLIDELLLNSNYEIHIIPHVIDKENYTAPENDVRACEDVKRRFGDRIVLAPAFDNPIEAKSYISNMDVFIGARMHSTIGAVSSGIATIPFAYSKKFEGLFGNLDYPYIVDGRKFSTKEAVKLTKEYIDNRKALKQSTNNLMSIVSDKLEFLQIGIKSLIRSNSLNQKGAVRGENI